MKWWLISDEDIQAVRKALDCAVRRQDERCAETGCMCDLDGSPHSAFYSDALHALDSGLHETDAVPEDYRQEEVTP